LQANNTESFCYTKLKEKRYIYIYTDTSHVSQAVSNVQTSMEVEIKKAFDYSGRKSTSPL